ncbi:hypothetical protein HGRIS_000522 [Hohenbuehelia grisea]|uniref:Cyclin N-terminal domain-containing protein n=1 Tax=Hohenbuehelia grisea TaxID=104357 RepID=A0ABR3JSM8_9AGAR
MASNIPRRTTRVTRTTANENIEPRGAGPTRSRTAKSQPLKAAACPTAPTTKTSRLTAPTLASKAKTIAKTDKPTAGMARRAALTDLTAPRNTASVTDGATRHSKGKAKEASVAESTNDALKMKATRVQRAPLRPSHDAIPTRTTRSSARLGQQATKRDSTVGIITATENVPPTRVLPERLPVFKPPATEEPQTSDSSRFATSVKRHHEEDVEAPRVFKRHQTSPTTHDESQLEADAVAAHLDEADEPQADTELWDDLDADDWDDPVMVSEYVNEIFEYFKDTELQTLPNPDYMASQPELTWGHRAKVIDWLIGVHNAFRLLPESLFLAINIFDRFLSSRVISLSKVQLVAAASFFIACKTEEMMSPSVADMVYLTKEAFKAEEIIKAERFILRIIDYNLTYPSPMNFLRRASKADGLEINARTVGKYLLEVCCIQWRLVGVPPSLQAAASLWLGRLVFGREEWTPNLAHYSGYSEEEILPVANVLLDHLVAPVIHEALYKKYAAKKYSKVSVLLQQWALRRWDEGSSISLLEDLPNLKAEAADFRHRIEEEERAYRAKLEAEERQRAG